MSWSDIMIFIERLFNNEETLYSSYYKCMILYINNVLLYFYVQPNQIMICNKQMYKSVTQELKYTFQRK